MILVPVGTGWYLLALWTDLIGAGLRLSWEQPAGQSQVDTNLAVLNLLSVFP